MTSPLFFPAARLGRLLPKLGKALLMATCWLSLPAAHAAPALQVAAAADLASCLTELNDAFAKSVGGADIKSSIGSSGNFYAQIRNGAPYDVFLSADTDYPRALAKTGMADAASMTVYAHGQLVLWSMQPELDLDAGFAVLKNPKILHIAIANPALAPYGRAAQAALEKAGVWNAIQSKLVLGENVAQTAQFIETGNAQVGLVGIAHTRNQDKQVKGRSWLVPADYYPLIEQAGIVTARGRDNPLAARYLAFLRSDAGRAILRNNGFALPPAP
jgi:molybdate transport system substrate-binding protein